jgi:hypothetical protein
VVIGFARYITVANFADRARIVRQRLWRTPRMIGNPFAAAPGGAN